MTEPIQAKTSFPKNRIKILLLEGVHPSAQCLLNTEGFSIEVLSHALSEEELISKIEDVHVIGIRSKTRITPKVLHAAKRLLMVGCFCIGTNQVALEDANLRGVPVFNSPFSNTRSVAELMIGEIISLARQLYERSREVHEGRWIKSAANSFEIRGKNLGIVGYGHIGSQLGVLAESMGMRVFYYDIVTKLPMGNNQSVASLNELLAHSDFVSLHVPETTQTKGMIGENELRQMKKGSYLLNASRGQVVDLFALASALREGHLSGAAVDVYPEEPETNGPGFSSPLQGVKNVILTPHVGGSTAEAQEAIGREVAGSMIKFINTGATTGAVNFPQVELPLCRGRHRILNIHQNVPGVLRDINKIVSEHHANIESQMLATDANIGYLLMDLGVEASDSIHRALAALSTTIKTRILY